MHLSVDATHQKLPKHLIDWKCDIMRVFYNILVFISFLTISWTHTINKEDVCGKWFYKSTKIYLYQDGRAYITNIRGSFPVSDDIPDTLTCKWKMEDNRITISGIYMFEMYAKDKNELYAYKGDPDDLNTFSFKRIQNK